MSSAVSEPFANSDASYKSRTRHAAKPAGKHPAHHAFSRFVLDIWRFHGMGVPVKTHTPQSQCPTDLDEEGWRPSLSYRYRRYALSRMEPRMNANSREGSGSEILILASIGDGMESFSNRRWANRKV
jgi:hypothetical protein